MTAEHDAAIAEVKTRAGKYVAVNSAIEAIHDKEWELYQKGEELPRTDDEERDRLREERDQLQTRLGTDAIALLDIVDALTASDQRATEWLNATVTMCAREILYFRQYDLTRDEIHHAHQTFVGLMYQALFALTGEKDFDVLRKRVLAEIEQAASAALSGTPTEGQG